MIKAYERANRITRNEKEKLNENRKKSLSIKESIFEEVLDELIANDLLYGDVIKLLKNYYNEIKDIINENDNLKKINKAMNEQIEDMKNSSEILIKTNEMCRSQIENLQKENESLKIQSNKSKELIKKFEMKIEVMASLLKREKFISSSSDEYDFNIENNKTKKPAEIILIGRNKVKVPKLNLSSVNKDEDENENTIKSFDSKIQISNKGSISENDLASSCANNHLETQLNKEN